jgi:uncharacterized protein YqgC (DUF456 family)
MAELGTTALPGLGAGFLVDPGRAGGHRAAGAAGLILIAWIDGFANVSLVTMFLMGLLAMFSVIIDFLATAEGARRFGAGRHAILGAALGLLVGLFFGLPGILLGPFVGAVIGHLLSKARIDDSMRAGFGATIGVVIGTISKVAIAVIMLVWFAVAWVL